MSRVLTVCLGLAGTALGVAISPAAEPAVIDPAGVYIRATALNESAILAGYTAHASGQSILRAAVAGAPGVGSWKFLSEVYRAESATHDVDNAMPLRLPSGRILYSYRNHDKDPQSPGPGGWTYYRITVSKSDDDGRTWQFLSQVDERRANQTDEGRNGLWEPFLRLARDGRVQAYYSSESDKAHQLNLMRWSGDDGATWSEPITVSGGANIRSRDGMTGVAEVDGNGNLICVFENTEDGPFSIDRVLSSDDGYTWGGRGRVYTAGNGKNAGAPQVVNVGGTLVASFETNENTDTPTIDGGEFKVVTSTDGGASWSSSPVVIAGQGSHWPGLFALNGNQFLALYSSGGQGAVSRVYGVSS